MTHDATPNEEQNDEHIKALQDLVEVLHKEDIEFTDDEHTRAESSRDASVFTMMPKLVIYPRNSGEIGVIVRALKSSLSVTPRAGGTCMTGAPLTESISLNLTKHMAYIEVNPASQNAIVEMGAMYRDIETKTMEHGLFFAGYTSSKDICGIGGMLGNNASGEKSVRYGATIDNVISLKAILRDGFEYEFGELNEAEFEKKCELETLEGDIYREVRNELKQHADAVASISKDHPVKKCASGYRIDRVYDASRKTYSLAPLFVGSQSTLGIITEAKLNLTKKLEHRKLLFMGVRNLAVLPAILKTIMSNDPESVETFDINTFDRARGFHPEHTNRIESFAKGKKATLNDAGYSLFVLAEFADDDATAVAAHASKTAEELSSIESLHVLEVDSQELYESIWKIRRTSFSVFRDYVDGTKHAVPCIEDVIVPITKFDAFVPGLMKILNDQGIFYGFHGHIGDGSLRILPVFDLADPEVTAKIDALCSAVFTLIRELGGNMSADHSDGIIRTPYLREFYGSEIYNIFAAIKNIFDPERIFNPNKKIGGTRDDVKKYLIKV